MMPDVQSSADTRQLAIHNAGVKSVLHPVQVRLKGGAVQSAAATWDLDVALPATQKGTHMSRFVELLMAHEEPLDGRAMRAMAHEMLRRLHAVQGRIVVSFPLFIRKVAPVSGVESYLDYRAGFEADATPAGVKVTAKVVVPVKSLCPCSKEISEYGAHNQRSHVTIAAELKGTGDDDAALEELIRYAEEEASSELWGLLKRPDEKYITERAYENPKFVEDLVRDVAGRLNADARVGAYVVEAENFESIHNHSAYARIVRA